MTYAWATWLKAAIESDPVLRPRLVEVDGWQTRGRPADQFSFFPSGIVDHHTACMLNLGHDPAGCLRVIRDGGAGLAPPPISQLFVSATPVGVRWDGSNADPRVYLIAAGRANHAGSGTYPWGAPAGNGSSIGIEVCGPPVHWPDLLIEVRERLDAAIVRNRLWHVGQITTHNEYAPTRKIDPSGPYDAQPGLGRTTPWDADTWRSRVHSRFLSEDDMMQTDLPPRRLLDTRPASPQFKLKAGGTALVNLPECAGRAAQVSVTVVEPEGAGHLTAWGSGERPETSFMNVTSGASPISETLFVPVASDGTFRVWSLAKVHLIVDFTGVVG